MNNVPSSKLTSSSDSTVRAFDNYYSSPIELSATVLDAMVGFFTGRGFEKSAAESISVVIMTQAKKDGYNPMQILDTLKGLDSVEISALVAEILNYNRFKTSFLGYARQFTAYQEVIRNVVT